MSCSCNTTSSCPPELEFKTGEGRADFFDVVVFAEDRKEQHEHRELRINAREVMIAAFIDEHQIVAVFHEFSHGSGGFLIQGRFQIAEGGQIGGFASEERDGLDRAVDGDELVVARRFPRTVVVIVLGCDSDLRRREPLGSAETPPPTKGTQAEPLSANPLR